MLLLVYSVNTHALSTLSASTVQVINGTGPYLSFDNGRTRVTTTDGLLGITFSNGTSLTPANNWTNSTNPIVLPNSSDTLANVSMWVPTNVSSITLNELIGAPNNFWGDDDGDNGITATGSLSVSITDKENQPVSRNATLDICKAPYKVVLSSTNGSLTTQYGVPNSSNFGSSNATYYINPNSVPKVCYARPILKYDTNNVTINETPGWNFAGPANIWRPGKGFLVQSTDYTSYSRNFPTTGAHNLYFDLEIRGSGPLRWPTVAGGGITATMKPTPGVANDGTSIRVTLTGQVASEYQQKSDSPGKLRGTITLPQTFELVGYDGSNRAVVKYGFVLKHWFATRGENDGGGINGMKADASISWCSSIGYRMVQVKDLTNAVCSGVGVDATYRCTGAVGATPSSTGNHYQRNIGTGLFSEWGFMYDYGKDANFVPSIKFGGEYLCYWTKDINSDRKRLFVNAEHGSIHPSVNRVTRSIAFNYCQTVCVKP